MNRGIVYRALYSLSLSLSPDMCGKQKYMLFCRGAERWLNLDALESRGWLARALSVSRGLYIARAQSAERVPGARARAL